MTWSLVTVFTKRKRGPIHQPHLSVPPRSQAQRALALLGIWLVIAIACGDWQAINMQRAASIENFLVGQTNLTNGMRAQTLQTLGMVGKALRDIADSFGGNPFQASEGIPTTLRSRATFDLLQNSLKPLTGILSLTLIDANGQTANESRAWPPSDDTVAKDISRQDLLRQLRSGSGAPVAIGPPRQAGQSGTWSVLLARRLNDAAGRFAGVAVAEISLADLEEFYHLAMPIHRTISLVRPDGTILLRYPHASAVAGRKIPALSPFYAAAAKGGTYFETDILDGKPVVAVSRALPGLPLIIETLVPMDEVLAGWRVQRHWMILAGVAVCAGVIALICLFAAQLHRLAVRNSQLDEARRQLDVAISNVSQGICFFDGQYKLIVCNGRLGEIYGLPKSATRPGTSFADMVEALFSVGAPTNMTKLELLMSREGVDHASAPQDFVFEFPDGRAVAVHERPMPDGGWVATHEDITERRRSEEQISFLARHDALTGLPNRSLLAERIALARAGAGRGFGFALLFLDLDRFKIVNDTLGHAAGDDLLKHVADRLRGAVRDGDTVARLGGDEFVVLQSNVKAAQAAALLAERIIAALGAPYAIAGNEVLIGVSIGIDIATNDLRQSQDLLKNADIAMYSAKSEGRGVYRFFEPEMDAQVQKRHLLERDLRRGLERGEFVLHYQAIVDGKSGRIRGFEALLRWNQPARGLVGPDEFIPLAEETGLIVQIGAWVVEQACRDAAFWPGGLYVSVNLSAVQFRAPDLVEIVRDALAAAGLSAERLELEVTESVLLHNNAHNLAMMHALRARGIGIAMDDFGTGHSSLSYLRQFPFQRIKIDRSFVKDIATDREAASVIRAILGLCRDLGIKTTAEGVETADQLAVLLAGGATDMQGYLFSRPKPASMLRAMLAEGRLMSPEATIARVS
jgi:diguanylate cyclase (GGDEF)-like protein